MEFDQDRFPPIWSALLQLDAQLNDYPALDRHAQRAIEFFPTQPEFYLFKGIAASQLKKNDEAIEALVTGRDLVVDNKPLEGQFWSSLGDAYNVAKEFAKSDAAYDKALGINPDDATRAEQLRLLPERAGRAAGKGGADEPQVQRPHPPSPLTSIRTRGCSSSRANLPRRRPGRRKPSPPAGTKEAVLIEHYGDILFKLGDTARCRGAMEEGEGSGWASESDRAEDHRRQVVE